MGKYTEGLMSLDLTPLPPTRANFKPVSFFWRTFFFFPSAVFSITNNLCGISCKIIDRIFHVLLLLCFSLQGCFPSLLLDSEIYAGNS